MEIQKKITDFYRSDLMTLALIKNIGNFCFVRNAAAFVANLGGKLSSHLEYVKTYNFFNNKMHFKEINNKTLWERGGDCYEMTNNLVSECNHWWSLKFG